MKVRDPKLMAAWYETNLGIDSKAGYVDSNWREKGKSGPTWTHHLVIVPDQQQIFWDFDVSLYD